MLLDKGFKEVGFYKPYKQYHPSRLNKSSKRKAFVADFIYSWWHAGRQPVTIIKPRSIKVEEMNISGVALRHYVCAN